MSALMALLLDLLLVCSWGEDWIFELPVASPQMTAIELKAFQAGMRRYPQDPNSTEPSPPIHMYIMVLHKRLSLTVTSIVGLPNKMSFRFDAGDVSVRLPVAEPTTPGAESAPVCSGAILHPVGEGSSSQTWRTGQSTSTSGR